MGMYAVRHVSKCQLDAILSSLDDPHGNFASIGNQKCFQGLHDP